jgi:hypothetical protein
MLTMQTCGKIYAVAYECIQWLTSTSSLTLNEHDEVGVQAYTFVLMHVQRLRRLQLHVHCWPETEACSPASLVDGADFVRRHRLVNVSVPAPLQQSGNAGLTSCTGCSLLLS